MKHCLQVIVSLSYETYRVFNSFRDCITLGIILCRMYVCFCTRVHAHECKRLKRSEGWSLLELELPDVGASH